MINLLMYTGALPDATIDDALSPDDVDLLAQAAAGLLMPSDTDAPFVTFRWPGAASLTDDALRTTLGLADTLITTRDVAAVVQPLITAQSRHTAEDTARCREFLALYDALWCLTKVVVKAENIATILARSCITCMLLLDNDVQKCTRTLRRV